MKPIKFILLILPFIFLSCQQSEKHTANQDIYDFMKIVIEEQKLDKNYALRITPETQFNSSVSDSVAFEEIIFNLEKKQEKTNKFNQYYDAVSLYNSISSSIPLSKQDITTMKLQKKELTTFKWDNARLGFNLSNEKRWYSFSIPLFSRDKTIAIMMIRDLCPGLCGSGETIVFTKENDKWITSIVSRWLH